MTIKPQGWFIYMQLGHLGTFVSGPSMLSMDATSLFILSLVSCNIPNVSLSNSREANSFSHKLIGVQHNTWEN